MGQTFKIVQYWMYNFIMRIYMLIYCTTSQVLYVVHMLLTISSLLNSQVKTAAQVNMFVTQLYMLLSMNACPLNLIIYITDNYCCVQQEYVLIT